MTHANAAVAPSGHSNIHRRSYPRDHAWGYELSALRACDVAWRRASREAATVRSRGRQPPVGDQEKPCRVHKGRQGLGIATALRAVGLLLLCVVGASHYAVAEENKPQDAKPTFYDPVEKQIEGYTIAVDPELLKEENKELADAAFKALGNHLQRIEFILPPEHVARLKKMRIWVELHNEKLGSMQYHPDKGWLVKNGHDPRLVKHVHVPRARDLVERRTWAKHPYVILHELAHAYHDQVLSFDHPDVIKAYSEAKEKGIYEDVLLFTGKRVRHYALTNHKEYFAEITEAYLGVNDFYPFVRAELEEHDPAGFALMQTIWGEVR